MDVGQVAEVFHDLRPLEGFAFDAVYHTKIDGLLRRDHERKDEDERCGDDRRPWNAHISTTSRAEPRAEFYDADRVTHNARGALH
jgi:hypothetical protein